MEHRCDIFDICILSGAIFGIYCKVLALIPAALALAAIYSVVALFYAESAVSLASEFVIPLVSLQGGYMIGLTSRDLIAPRVAGSKRM
jgi:hypothetical protein